MAMTDDEETFYLTEKPKKKNWLLWLIIILVIIGGIVWFAHNHAASTPVAAGGKHGANGPMPVSVVDAKTGSIPIVVNALGTVTSLANVTVRTQIAGQLTEVAYTEGQNVKQGDFLAQIDPRPYQLALNQAQGQLQRDQALLQTAQTDLKRYQTLMAQDSIAKQQLDTQASLVKQYKGAIAIDQAQVETAKLNLQYCHIVAPVNGRVGLRQVDQGNYVQTGDTNGIVVITQTQPISVIFSVPEDNLPSIMKRLAANVTLAVTAYDRSQTTILAKGVLTTVDNVIDPTTGTFKIRATFDNADNALYPNQFVNAQLLVDTLDNVIVLPSAAIQRGQPGTFVYVVKPDSTVTMTKVTIGATSGDNVAVLSGVTEGQKVVSDGGDKLKDGAKVLLPGAAPDKTDPNSGPSSGNGKHHAKHAG
jgi:multidrug efflux system membrane fusion protein